MPVHKDFYTSYDMFEGESISRVAFLMHKYHWQKDEAIEYYFYDPYDEEVWEDYD